MFMNFLWYKMSSIEWMSEQLSVLHAGIIYHLLVYLKCKNQPVLKATPI